MEDAGGVLLVRKDVSLAVQASALSLCLFVGFCCFLYRYIHMLFVCRSILLRPSARRGFSRWMCLVLPPQRPWIKWYVCYVNLNDVAAYCTVCWC